MKPSAMKENGKFYPVVIDPNMYLTDRYNINQPQPTRSAALKIARQDIRRRKEIERVSHSTKGKSFAEILRDF
jgi:hypothetical protein